MFVQTIQSIIWVQTLATDLKLISERADDRQKIDRSKCLAAIEKAEWMDYNSAK